MSVSALGARIDEALRHAPASLREAFGMLDVEETEDVPTAVVSGRGVPVVRINPRFVERHCPTPQALAALLMHEALHVVLGHTTRDDTGPASLENVVFDAIINSIICRMQPGPEWTSFITAFYQEGDPVECFLRPAPGFDPARAAVLPAALAAKPYSRGASLYRSLYGKRGVPESDLREHLRKRLQEKVPPYLVLLGGHGREGGEKGRKPGETGDGAGAGRAVAREVLAGFRQEVEGAVGRKLPGPGGEVVDRTVVLDPAVSRPTLAGLIRQIGGRDRRREGISSWRDPGELDVVGVLPAPDRRSVLWRAAGATPLLFRRSAPERQIPWIGEKVHIYLDVSGSVEGLLGRLYAAVRDVRHLVSRDVHLFSTELLDVPISELAKGVCQTTGGTSIVPLARHIREQGVRRAVIVTDGEVGPIGARDRETLRGTVLGVALTGGRERNGDLARLARRVVVLTGLTRSPTAGPPSLPGAGWASRAPRGEIWQTKH